MTLINRVSPMISNRFAEPEQDVAGDQRPGGGAMPFGEPMAAANQEEDPKCRGIVAAELIQFLFLGLFFSISKSFCFGFVVPVDSALL